MTKEEVILLIDRYLQEGIDPKERLMLENWYARESAEQMKFPEMEDYVRIRKEMWVFLNDHKPKKEVKLWPRVLMIAAVLVGFAFGIWFFQVDTKDQGSVSSTTFLASSDIAPGGKGARITLSTGKIIPLNASGNGVYITNGQIRYADGAIAGDALSSELTASTDRGQTYVFNLADGTRVWLNAASSLRFPSRFKGKQRTVELQGEGYFEVSKNPAQPFVVKTSKQEIEVLGTHFNLNAYDDEALEKTTLLEGSVQLKTKEGQVRTLLPGQQAKSGNSAIQVRSIDVNDEIAWVNGDFVFKAESLESIMKEVSRWYSVEVVYHADVDKNMILGGLVSRSKNISAVLKMMELTKLVRFKIEGKTVTVMPY